MLLNVYSGFDDLPFEYRILFEENSANSIFISLTWFKNFVATAVDPGDKIHLYGLESQSSACVPLALLPMRSCTPHRKLSSLSNYYSTSYAPLVRNNADTQECLDALARGVCSGRPYWEIMDFSPMRSDRPQFEQLAKALRSAGMAVQTYFCSGNWYTPLEGRHFGEYWDSLPSSVRNIAKSKNRKIERSKRVHVEVVTGGARLDEAIQNYQTVYSASWKVPEPYVYFIPGLIRMAADRNWLRLGLAYVDGVPAAAQIWLVNCGIAYIYKIAYDQKYAALSVGSYLTNKMMEYVIDTDRVEQLDYLSGDDRYKRDWMSHRRELWGIMAANPRTLRGSLATARHIGGRAVKKVIGLMPGFGKRSVSVSS
jgi:hypothetical protein